MGYYDKLRRMLIKDIKSTTPFCHIKFPKTIKCIDAELTAAGERYYDEDYDSEGCFWRSVTFKGDNILVTFDCVEEYNGLNISYEMKTTGSDTYVVSTHIGLDDFLNELKFVKDVLEFSEY